MPGGSTITSRVTKTSPNSLSIHLINRSRAAGGGHADQPEATRSLRVAVGDDPLVRLGRRW